MTYGIDHSYLDLKYEYVYAEYDPTRQDTAVSTPTYS